MKGFLSYFPFAVFALELLVFVRPVSTRRTVRLVCAALGLACAAKFVAFQLLGGDPFAPVLPEKAIWVWNWAYSGFMLLAPLACLARLVRLRGRVLWLLVPLAWGLAGRGVWNGLCVPPPVVHEVAVENLPASLEGYTIVQLSDIHVSSAATRWRTEAIVRRANALDADLVVITGDIVDGRARDQAQNVEPLRNLRARNGVFCVTGNHELYNCFWSDWKRHYEAWGLRFIDDACVRPRPDLALAGRRDLTFDRGGVAHPPETLFADATNGEFRVLLDHQPRRARETCRATHFDLQLSGHTHGGVMPGMRELVRVLNKGFVRGLYTVAPASRLYVSPGAGQWAGFPVRFFNDSEIAVLKLKSATKQ